MLSNSSSRKRTRQFPMQTYLVAVAVVTMVAGWTSTTQGTVFAKDKKDKMGSMDMSCMADMNGVDMSAMGPSMDGMTCHMYITPLRQPQAGDEEKARAVVAAVRSTADKYQDYKKAEADGYVWANPKVKQPQYHFNNDANAKAADVAFDPTKPTSLLYRQMPDGGLKLEGVMFTTRPNATEDDLNERVPLSMAHWHKHVNFCGAPADKTSEYHGSHPKFGMFGSIHTKAACDAEHGTFMPQVFTWMMHVFPYEDPKDVFSLNDDVPHVH